ncbi:hypothetical protein UA08_06131 [Talaromyces atroroseus]|uniref:Major facilitator superfamily (MFS) profile domain-containing protein n=1 Tax=Talaromyces atroroseus TaxID=1441469 RepID=A0A225AU21_TALAT|nr:hypothetical protein UA08_06131 [Talaromyces atroroseus]OKL58436.1 hypothetical protein UA08_06131 [Talaromyces atroroseus]
MTNLPSQGSQRYSRKQIATYLSTRISNLAPRKGNPAPRNPFKILRQVTRAQWLMFLCGALGRGWDAFGYSTVTMTVTELSVAFDAANSAVSWAITITLMMRPIGAFIFGTCCDRYGRRWPMIVNLVCLMVLEMASGFCTSLSQFLGVRALYGVAMGGPSAAIALEDLPPDAQCILSGLFEGCTSLGTLIASSMYRALVPTTPHGWRSLFWFGAGPPVLLILLRWWLPETQHFQRLKAEREAKIQALKGGEGGGEGQHTSEFKTFVHDSVKLIRQHWVLLTYMFLLMAGFNACAHGAIDLYPTFLKNQVQMDPAHTSIITIIGNLGAFCGGITMGHVGGFAGRRLTMLCNCILGAAILPAFLLPRGRGGMVLGASVFFQHVALIGVWGPIPIHLVELAPVALRTLMVGLTYQLGNLAASPITTIETYYGEQYPLPPAADGTKRYDYGRAIAIFVAASWAYMFVFLLLGPDSDRGQGQEGVITMYLDGLESEPQSPADLEIEKGAAVVHVDELSKRSVD